MRSISAFIICGALGSGLFAGVAVAVPAAPVVVTDQLAWDGLDGQMSMELPGAHVDAVAADDFAIPAAPAQGWRLREAKALFIADGAAAPSEFRLRIFGDTLRHTPGAVVYTRNGAATVTDRGPAVGSFRLYEVAFSLSATACPLAGSRRYWIAIDHVGATSHSFYLATSGHGVIHNSAGLTNRNFPAGPWAPSQVGPRSDYAIYTRVTAGIGLPGFP